MACYGMVKALLERGVEVDLVLPTREEVIFPLRRPADADELPVRWMKAPPPEIKAQWDQAVTITQRLKVVGVSTSPESYLGPAKMRRLAWNELLYSLDRVPRSQPVEVIRQNLSGEEELFKKIREFTVRAADYAGKLDFDLIHAHDWLTFAAGLVCRKKSGKPMAAHVHATEFDRAAGAGDERIHKIEHAGMSAAEMIIAVSRYTANLIIHRYRIDPAKIKVVHNAHSMNPPDPAHRRRIFKGPLIVFLGRVTIQKGPDYFVKVASQVLKRHPDAHFIMAGGGDMWRKMIHQSAAFRMGQHFLFSKFLNRAELTELLGATDIFIMPSVSEPFGIVPLEAMAHGAATIISKQSGVAEVIENVRKVDFWDLSKMTEAVCRLIDNPEERIALASAGQKEAFGLKWESVAEKIQTLYKELAPC